VGEEKQPIKKINGTIERLVLPHVGDNVGEEPRCGMPVLQRPVQGSGSRFRIHGSGSRVHGPGFRIH